MSDILDEDELPAGNSDVTERLVAHLVGNELAPAALLLREILETQHQRESEVTITRAAMSLGNRGHQEMGVQLLLQACPREQWQNRFRATYINLLRMQGNADEANALLEAETHPKIFVLTRSLDRLLPTIETQPKYAKRWVSDELRGSDPEEALRVARMVFDDLSQCELPDLQWYTRLALRLRRFDDIRDVWVAFLTRHHSRENVRYAMGFVGSTLLQDEEAKHFVFDIWRKLLEVAPWTRNSCLTFAVKMRAKQLSEEAGVLIRICEGITDQAVRASSERTSTNARMAVVQKRRRRTGQPALVDRDLQEAQGHIAVARYDEAIEVLHRCIPLASQTRPASLEQWRALILFAECIWRGGDRGRLENILVQYERQGLITERFHERLVRYVSIATASHDDLPEAELGEYYAEYVRSSAFGRLREGSVPRRIEGRSRTDVSVLKNVDLNREGIPRPKKN